MDKVESIYKVNLKKVLNYKVIINIKDIVVNSFHDEVIKDNNTMVINVKNEVNEVFEDD